RPAGGAQWRRPRALAPPPRPSYQIAWRRRQAREDDPMRTGRFAVQALIAAAAAGWAALALPAAALTPPGGALVVPIAAPDQSKAIALSPAGVVAGGEQWEMFHGDR